MKKEKRIKKESCFALSKEDRRSFKLEAQEQKDMDRAVEKVLKNLNDKLKK